MKDLDKNLVNCIEFIDVVDIRDLQPENTQIILVHLTEEKEVETELVIIVSIKS